jgi:peptidoglycan/LPS O-acetylase OafA/YrhL
MSKGTILIILGALVALAPFSGLPSSWLQFILPAVGIAVIALAYSFVPKKGTSKDTHPVAI